MYEKILVPLDGSARAERILPFVEELAYKFASQVVLMHVIEPTVTMVSPYDIAPFNAAEEMQRQAAEAQSYLATIESRLRDKAIEVKSCMENGPIVQSVLAVAEREQVNLIAMASHGRTGLSRVFYGSVAAGILHRADRPLLLIRAQE